MSGKLECKRCFTAFDITIHDPRLLDCGHTVCLTCLDDMLSSDNKLTCPFCKATTPYNKDPLSYKRNVTVVEALLPAGTNSSSDFHPKCDKCKSPSKKFCATCQKHFCTSCLEAHDYFFPKGHRNIDIEKMTPVELPAQPKLVKKAPEPKAEPAKAEPAKPVARKFSVSKKTEPPAPAPEEDAPKPNPWRKNSSGAASAPAANTAPPPAQEEEKESFPKPSANPWKKMDAAGEVTAPAGPASTGRERRASYKAPVQKKEEEAPAAAPAAAPAPAPAEEKSPRLPPGWAEVKDPRSGKVYYYNKKTKETSWTAPAAEPEPAASEPEPEAPAPEPQTPPGDALPPGWSEHVDQRSGKVYYYNKATKETSWKKPSATASPAPDELPPGWAEVVDPNSGKTYYYNKQTKETSWKRPRA